MPKFKRVTAHKYQGDDAYSWAIFVDNHPVLTGLTRREVPYYKNQVEERIQVNARLSTPASTKGR